MSQLQYVVCIIMYVCSRKNNGSDRTLLVPAAPIHGKDSLFEHFERFLHLNPFFPQLGNGSDQSSRRGSYSYGGSKLVADETRSYACGKGL